MRKPSIRMKKAAKNLIDNHGNVSKAMLDAGYTPATAHNPKNLSQSKTWQMLLDEIPDDLLKRKLEEGLEANKQLAARVIFKKEAPTSQSRGELPLATSTTDDFIEVPDHLARHKYLDTAFKLKNKYPAEVHKLQGDKDNPLSIEVVITEDTHAE